MKDLARFLAVLAIFVFGFSMFFVALNQAFNTGAKEKSSNKGTAFSDGEFCRFDWFYVMDYIISDFSFNHFILYSSSIRLV